MNVKRFVVNSGSEARLLSAEFVARSAWFACMPFPDDAYEFTFKEEVTWVHSFMTGSALVRSEPDALATIDQSKAFRAFIAGSALSGAALSEQNLGMLIEKAFQIADHAMERL